jgi:hypothetical protein
MLTDEVRHLTLHRPDAQVHAGLAEMDGLELRMAVRHVQKADMTRALPQRWQVVQGLLGAGGVGVGVTGQAHAGHGGCRQNLEEFALAQADHQ